VHAVRRIYAAASVAQIVVAAPAPDQEVVADLLSDFRAVVVTGGSTRQASVAAALAAVGADLDIVLVHDAARALTPPALIEAVAAAVRGGHDAVVPVLPVIDTIKQVDADEIVVATLDRSRLRVTQTPQGFRRAILAKAHAAAVDDATDDAGLVECLGIAVTCIPGDAAAMKITRPFDLALAELLLDHGSIS
jgi:2-C-methyl-D-erythritol 4-phosphate cytidylyltransferase